jgi:hypothetical protein
MVLPFFFPATLILGFAGPGRGEEPSGANVRRLIQIRLVTPSMEKISRASQTQSPQAQIADSNSRKAVSFSSACTKNADARRSDVHRNEHLCSARICGLDAGLTD